MDPRNDATEPTGVRVNGHDVSAGEMDEIEAAYGVRPAPGDYWYDARSGLYGVVGQPAAGFMLPGHPFPPLERGCSGGRTGILVNGRELSQMEWALLSQLIRTPIQPGAYWLDANGNAGIEGNPTPVVNFVLAAQQLGGGDNFWSTRFGAGNFDQGGQRGYVSVPGHGPIGYGFD